jgi:hypothetical protein
VFASLWRAIACAILPLVPLTSRVLVPHRDKEAIARALGELLSARPEDWTVTIRPSQTEAYWAVEVVAPGRFLAFGARPFEQDANSIVALVRGALALGPAPHSQE